MNEVFRTAQTYSITDVNCLWRVVFMENTLANSVLFIGNSLPVNNNTVHGNCKFLLNPEELLLAFLFSNECPLQQGKS